VHTDVKLFAGRDAPRSLVGSAASKAAAFNLAGVSSEGDHIQPKQVLQRSLELFDLGVEFEQQAGFGLRGDFADGDFGAEVERLAIDRCKFPCQGQMVLAGAFGPEFANRVFDCVERV